MNILVTGATGFVGSHLLDRLQTGRHRGRCMVAPFEMKAAPGLKSRGFEAVVADIMNRDEIRRAIPEGLDAVFHLAGILTETRKVKFVDIHVNATRNLVDACVEKNLKRFIFTTAFGAAPDAESALHRSTWECARPLRLSRPAHTLLPPAVIFGTGRGGGSRREKRVKPPRVASKESPVGGAGFFLVYPVRPHERARP